MDVRILPAQTVVGLKVGKCCISHKGAASYLLCLHPHSKQGKSKDMKLFCG